MFARIRPIPIQIPIDVAPRTATQLKVLEISIQGLGETVRVTVTWGLYDSLSNLLMKGSALMPRAVYDNWDDDDEYILEWLASVLDVKISEIVVPYEQEDEPVYEVTSFDDKTSPSVVVIQDK